MKTLGPDLINTNGQVCSKACKFFSINYKGKNFVIIISYKKCCFYGDRVITIAWSRFNSHSHPRRTRCCVLGWGSLRRLSLLTGFEQAAN